MEPKKQVTIYTDGACTGNPGPGGYGVVLLYGAYRNELSGGFSTYDQQPYGTASADQGSRKLSNKVVR